MVSSTFSCNPTATSTRSSTSTTSQQQRPLDIRSARQELADIIDWKSPDTSAQSVEYSISQEQEQRVLKLIQTYSCLAGEVFSDCRPLKNKYPPLAFLVEKNASLETVRLVYQQCPAAIHYKDRWGNTPLHFACMARASAQVISFLMDQDPTAICLPNRVGYCPLHFIMSLRSGRDLTCEVIDVLLPRAVSSLQMTNDLGLTPLDLSLKSNLPATALEYLFERAAQLGNIIKFVVPVRTDDARFGLKHAKALAKLLPTLTSFCYTQCHGKVWTHKAFCHLVQAIGISPSLETVVLDLPRRILVTDPKARMALEAMLCNPHSHLRELTLHNEERSATNEEEDGDDTWMEALVRGFCCNRTIDYLELHGVRLKSSAPLQGLFAGPWQPRTLNLLGLGVEGSWTTAKEDEPLNCLEDCRCETIRLEGPNWNYGLLQHLGNMPRLTRLRIAYTGPSDLTLPIVSLLKHSRSLRDLEVSAGCCVKNQVALVDALETHNLTLVKYTYASGMNRDTKARISYYTNLNQYGRAKASGSHCTKLEFINLLCSAAEDSDLRPFRRQMDLFNIHFGLLSLEPSLWVEGQ